MRRAVVSGGRQIDAPRRAELTDEGLTDGADISALRARVARGAGWIAAARVAMRALGFVNTIVVARLLAPEDFGLVAIGVGTMQMLQGFSDVGVSQAVVRFRDAGRADLDTLFTLSLIRGVLVAGLLAAIAPAAAGFYGDDRVLSVFLGVALFPLAIGLMNPRFFEFERELDFSKDFFVTTVNKLLSVAVSIAVALAFRTYWAIILGLITGGLTQLVLSYALRPYLPRLSFASFRKVFAFSGWLTGVSFVVALNNKLDALIVARLAGTANAGAYYVGGQLAELPTSEIATPIARAIYPGFSALEGRHGEMRRAYLQGVEALGVIALPAAVGFSFVAEDLVALLLGGKWSEAAPVIRILAPALGVQTLFLATQYYAMAHDRTRLVFLRELAYFVIRTPIVIWATIAHGLIGAASAAAATAVLHAFLNMALYARLSGGAFIEPLWAARRSLAAALAMTAYFLLVRPEFEWIAAAPLAMRVGVDIAAGAFVFLAVLYAAWRIEGAPDGVEGAVLDLARARL